MLLWMAIVWGVGLAQSVEPADCRATPPAGWVQLREEVHGVKVDVRYATGKNFTGAPLPGYHLPQAWLRETVATSLARAAQTVREQGFVLVVYDAYRPIRATEAMVDWARRTDQTHLVRDGYIASRSGHNHGHTIDLSLLTLAGDSVDMGSPFDHFGAESHHGALVSDQARHHRLVLKTAMESAGFRAYSKEWWHYRHPLSGTLPMDVPIGCPSKGKPSGGP